MRIHFLLHAIFEPPGAILHWVTKKGHIAHFTRSYRGEPLPTTNTFDFLIIMGGPQSATAIAQFPYLRDEILLTQQSIADQKPVLGVCLGAQIIGEALGAAASRSPSKEIGSFPITLSTMGMNDPLLRGLPNIFEVMHWHQDMPGLTSDAKILATSEGCPRQIVRYTDRVYGFQCHLEMTLEGAKEMLEHCGGDLSPSTFIQKPEAILAAPFETMHHKLYTILDRISTLSAP